MRKQKILFVITKSNWGGAGRYVFDLATNLSPERFDVCVALGGTGEAGAQQGLLAQKLTQEGARTIFIKSFMRNISVFSDLKSCFELYRLFKKEKPDVVHVNSSKAGGVGAVAARAAGIHKIVFTAHGWPFWEQRNLVSRGLIWLLSWLTALLSHKIIVVSNYDLAVAKKMPCIRHKVYRIYNGIKSDFSLELKPGNYVRKQFPQGARITGTIGELNKNKNQIALIEQAKNNPNMYVAICGDGENRLFLHKKIEEYGLGNRVKLFGFVEPRMVLRGFDVFALPSLKEGLPYVLLEARAAGLPIVANRVGGVSEIIDAKDVREFSLERMIAETEKIYQS